MGSEDRWAYPEDGEAPGQRSGGVRFLDWRLRRLERRLLRFVEETGYVTDAERFGWSFVFAGLLPDDFPPTEGVLQAPWWRKVEGADWRHPEGPHSSIAGRLDHPVVHVSWHDADAYCAWAGARLPRRRSGSLPPVAGWRGRCSPGDELQPDGDTG